MAASDSVVVERELNGGVSINKGKKDKVGVGIRQET